MAMGEFHKQVAIFKITPIPPPPPPHTHTHRTHTQNSLDFVLLTLLALDVQALRRSYKAGLEVDLLQRQSIALTLPITNAICVINIIFLPRSARRKHILSQDPLCATMINFYASPSQFGLPLNTPKWAWPRVKFSGMYIFNFGPSPLQFLDPPLVCTVEGLIGLTVKQISTV